MTFFEKLMYNEDIVFWWTALQHPYTTFACATMFKAFEKFI